MDKAIASAFQKVMHNGEKMAPVKSIKMKVKFNKAEVEDKKKELAKKLKN